MAKPQGFPAVLLTTGPTGNQYSFGGSIWLRMRL